MPWKDFKPQRGVEIDMAKHGTRRRGKRLIKGNVDESLTVGALANNTLISQNYGDVVQERTWIMSQEATWTLRDGTALEGGVVVGVAHSDYTSAEIEEFIENTGSWDEGDLVNQEVGRRKIRIVGAFPAIAQDQVLNEGKTIKTKLGFILNQGDTLKLFAYNRSGATLTTGSIVLINGWAWMRPT